MEIKNLTKVYKTEYELVKALNDMTISLPQKGLVFIVGVSGSGKSTLMNMLSGVDTPSSGEVVVGNVSLFRENKKQLFGYRNSYVGLIFQDYNLIEDINVYDNIKLPLELLGMTDFSVIDDVIKKVDIEDIKYSKVTEISSGQMQRVAIARALVKDSAMILADEPTGNLDSKNTKIVMDLLKEISKDRLVIVITHDDDAANEYGDRIITIEDGSIIDDHTENDSINVYDKSLEKSTNFIKPKISLKQQVRFTKGFIRNSTARSISIFFMLILIPVIGNILCGYAFFDISKSYYDYQDEYGSRYVQISDVRNTYNVNYRADEQTEKLNEYGEENLFELYSIYSPISSSVAIEDYLSAKPENAYTFYKPIVQNLIVDNTQKVDLIDGEMPEITNVSNKATIAITDYLIQSYKTYNEGEGLGIGSHFNIGGVDYEIVGIVNTNFEDFLGSDFNESLTRISFEENLTYYNAVYTSYTGYQYIKNNSKYFIEEAVYKVMPDGSMKNVISKNEYVVIRNVNAINGMPTRLYGYTQTFASQIKNYSLVSESLWQIYMERKSSDFSRLPSFSFICHSTSYYNFNAYVHYVYKNSDRLDIYGTIGEVILKEDRYKTYLNKQEGSKFLFDKDSKIYKNVVENENVVNESFKYAKATWNRCESSKFVMYEFLITLLIIMAVFSYIINSMTLNIEKKKIGIKYSFGISKFPITVPYLLETLLYIFTGVVISLFIVKFVYPTIVTNLIYTSLKEKLEYEFFYISTRSIITWDLVVYAIMGTFLVSMILSICRKSPIEIIKDL